MSETIAIVGRPNVGKSRLFNALAGKRLAIVHDQPGVTRDNQSFELAAGLTLVDTGGWGLSHIRGLEAEAEALAEAVEEQVAIAIEAASVILFVVDGRAGVTSLDSEIARFLRSHKNRVWLLVNKVDSENSNVDEGEFLRLGFPNTRNISAEHGLGIAELKAQLLKLAPEIPPVKEEVRRPSLCIIGKPNVGKSSLSNALLKSPKTIVSPISGTTRDAVAFDLDYTGKKGEVYRFRLIDTAGMRHRTKVGSSVEVFSQMRTREALSQADIVVLVIDAQQGITSQDKLLAGDILKEGKPLVVAVNKWDLALEEFKDGPIQGFETIKDFESACQKNLEAGLFFTTGAPMVFLSAKDSLNLEGVLKAAKKLEESQDLRLPTPEINKIISKLLWKNAPRNANGRFFKIYYATQTGNRPYRLKMFCNLDEGIGDNFRRYMAKGFAEHFGVEGCPFFFDFVGKAKRYPKKLSEIKNNRGHGGKRDTQKRRR